MAEKKKRKWRKERKERKEGKKEGRKQGRKEGRKEVKDTDRIKSSPTLALNLEGECGQWVKRSKPKKKNGTSLVKPRPICKPNRYGIWNPNTEKSVIVTLIFRWRRARSSNQSKCAPKKICKILIDKSKNLEFSIPSVSPLYDLKITKWIFPKRRIRYDGAHICQKGHPPIAHNEDCEHLLIKYGSIPAAAASLILETAVSFNSRWWLLMDVLTWMNLYLVLQSCSFMKNSLMPITTFD